MEESKRKKKNKKNKGKTTSAVEEAISTSGAQDEKRENAPESNHREPEKINSQSVPVSESEGDLEKLKLQQSKIGELEEIIKDLEATVISCIDKEVIFEQKIDMLQSECDLFGKKEVGWNLKLEELRREMSAWLTNAVNMDERLKNIETDRESRTLEKSNSEILAELEEIDVWRQLQVRESETAKVSLAEENQELTNRISLLEERVQHLEILSAAASLRPPDIIATEVSERDFATSDDIPVSDTSSSLIPEKELPELPLKASSIAEENADMDSADTPELQPLDALNQITEIVQIPLNDDVRGQTQPPLAQQVKVDDTEAVPLTDAPLIGAPFRLISFFAKYVSGADLVQEKSKLDQVS